MKKKEDEAYEFTFNKINITEKNIKITSQNSYQELFSHL